MLNPLNKCTGASLLKWESETQLDMKSSDRGAFEFHLVGDECSATFATEHKSMLIDIMLQDAGSAIVQRFFISSQVQVLETQNMPMLAKLNTIRNKFGSIDKPYLF